MVAYAGAMAGAMLSVLLWMSAPVVTTVAVGLFLIVALLARWWRGLLVAVAAALGALWVAQATLATQIKTPRVARVLGCVVSPVWLQDRRIRFSMRTLRIDGKRVRKRLSVSAYDGVHVPRAGDCYVWQLKLRPPRGLLNHTGDDSERRAFVRGIDGYATVDANAAVIAAGTRWQSSGLRWRLKLARRIQFLSGEQAPWPLFVALTVGERGPLPEHWREVMRDTGTAHLMAISGLHVGLLAGFGLGVGRFFLAPLLRAVGGTRWAMFAPWAAALLCATFYAALAGFALPTVRALIMLWVFGLAALARRQVSIADGLALALIVALLMSPRALLDAGLWLSFGAVAALMTLRLQLRERAWLAQWVAFVGLLPFVAVFIGRVSWVSPLANAVSVPLFALGVVPLTLSASTLVWFAPGFAVQMYTLAGAMAQWHFRWLGDMSLWPGAGSAIPDWTMWHLTLASFGVCALLLRIGGGGGRVVAMAACLPLFLARAPAPAYGQFVVEVLDVGQAMSVVVRTRSRTLVYDAGALWQTTDAARRIVVPQLNARGIYRVDRVVISHADMDHRGGAATLAHTYPRARWWSGEVLRLGIAAQPCAGAASWRWDGVVFSFIHPTTTHPWHGNNASCVLLIRGRHGRALITGDLEALGELSMLYAGRVPAVDLVVGQHHGSATSSTEAFVRATRPISVIFPTGYNNRWSLPRVAIQRRWRRVGAQVYHTAADGAVRCVFNGAVNSPELSAARQARPALWRSAAVP
ncbi:MAG: DNA internalization-related competence protein ComEC/Rec2 [Gammaproteobacteria bacterium]